MTLFSTLLAAGAPTPAVFWHTGGVAAALTALVARSVMTPPMRRSGPPQAGPPES